MNTLTDVLFDPQGFLFIGDPHVSSKKVGRRKDDYLTSVLDKLESCASLCREHQLVPVILGDLFHRNDDSHLGMLNRLTRVLKAFPLSPLVLEGNHDKEQTEASDADALTLLAQMGVVQVLSRAGDALSFSFSGHAVRLLTYPYGASLPRLVESFDGVTFAITHHDLAFGSTYPGSIPLQEIAGCDAVINGHMHDTKQPVQVGSTWWHNPGNIEPLSVDLARHVPRAWKWVPGQPVDALEGLALPHGSDLFDLTGLQVQAAEGAEIVEAFAPAASEFAQLLSSQTAMDAGRTDDATILLEDLNDVLEISGVSELSKQLMQALAAELVIEATSA